MTQITLPDGTTLQVETVNFEQNFFNFEHPAATEKENKFVFLENRAEISLNFNIRLDHQVKELIETTFFSLPLKP